MRPSDLYFVKGLVILEALYFPLEDTGAPITEFGIDVTAPVQTLVHDGQLFIPGGRSKARHLFQLKILR